LVTVDYLWARHLLVWGIEGQRKIRGSSVLVAGAGAIGNEVAKNLAMLGVGKIVIADRDVVEMSNVSRMVFFRETDLGKNKAEVLAKNIHARYPYAETTAFRGDLAKMPLKLYLDSDVVVCGLDNVISRIYLVQTSRQYGIPLVDGGIIGLNGRVHVYIPPNDACPICMFPPNQYSRIVGLRNPCDAPPDQEATPSFSTSISLVSSILAQEVIKLVLGIDEYRSKTKWPESSGEPLRAVLFVDLKNNRYTTVGMKRGEKCYVCGKEGTAKAPARIMEFPIQSLQKPGHRLEEQVAANSKLEGRMQILGETAGGTIPIDGKTRLGKSLKRGDYLRILLEDKNGEFSESILRLT
jgi:molybdopterin/thiamine biosynthesis adenylyltransferase